MGPICPLLKHHEQGSAGLRPVAQWPHVKHVVVPAGFLSCAAIVSLLSLMYLGSE